MQIVVGGVEEPKGTRFLTRPRSHKGVKTVIHIYVMETVDLKTVGGVVVNVNRCGTE